MQEQRKGSPLLGRHATGSLFRRRHVRTSKCSETSVSPTRVQIALEPEPNEQSERPRPEEDILYARS